MPYQRFFPLADSIITHLNPIVTSITDTFISTRYTGLVSIAAVTVYELSIKDIFYRFSQAKHKVFGTFVNSYFERINGKIKIKTIKEEYLIRFGDIYVNRFSKKLDILENRVLRQNSKSIKSSYSNIIEWRNQFAHAGNFLSTVTYQEAVDSYNLGKQVIHCLAKSLKR